MRFYNRQHRHYRGIDLHVKTMYACILDAADQTLVHRNIKSTPEALLETIAPYRDDLVIAITTSPTPSRSRRCCAAGLPQAYVYPAAMRATRDLLRRRLHLVRKRGLLAHIQNARVQYQLAEFGPRKAYPANRTGVSAHFPDPIALFPPRRGVHRSAAPSPSLAITDAHGRGRSS